MGQIFVFVVPFEIHKLPEETLNKYEGLTHGAHKCTGGLAEIILTRRKAS